MIKRPVVLSLMFLAGLISCSPEPVPVRTSSVDTSKTGSVKADEPYQVKSMEELLPQVPLVKFPLLLGVENFENKKAIPVATNEGLSWFADAKSYPDGAKVVAVGKFYLNLKVIAVIFLVTSPGETDRPDDKELILTIVNTETGKMNSRSVATANAEDYGRTFMKTPEEGKSFMHFESEEITITFREFGIVDGKFIPDKSQIKTFPGNQKGSDASDKAIKNWMK